MVNGACSLPSLSNCAVGGASGSNQAGVTKLDTDTPLTSYVGASTGSQTSKLYTAPWLLFAQRLQLGSMNISSTSCESTLETLQSPVVVLPPLSSSGLAATTPHSFPPLSSVWKPSTPCGWSAMVSTIAMPCASAISGGISAYNRRAFSR